MRGHLKYWRYIIRHKWFVFVAGRRTGAPLWRLIIHDWSKFLPSEWRAYVRKFHGRTPSFGALEFVIHWATDWAKCRGRFGFRVDQGIHIACKVLWAT